MSEETDAVVATFDCWAVNSETAAASRYENFPFHSMVRIGDHYYATSDEGLFRLGGDDDAGAEIHCMLVTGKTDFGTEALKSVTQASIGYSATSPLLFSAIYNQSGQETSVTYQVDSGYVGVEREARVKIGRGGRSRYWQFVIENTAGGNLTLDRLDFDVMRLSRRV
ncbi:hypothetical protein [Solimonas marina]|uniref:Uncharacterized protein n=1 Tax=Solimonas marina TaxID=2714601 RepID=A0A969W6N6_9GAMM|nr:hypothetical protein [Solimonas marina]NKF21572.1 hypothetical protein [Solimonas marina]